MSTTIVKMTHEPARAAPQKSIADISVGSVPSRAMSVAEDLRTSLGDVLEACMGPNSRPAALSRELNLGQSISSRILRAVKSDDPVRVLEEIPSPQGLTMFLDAAEGRVSESVFSKAHGSVRRFERLLSEFPNGRSGMHAMLAGWDDESHVRACNAAAQAVYRSMTTMLGFQGNVTAQVNFFLPSKEDPEWCDHAFLMFKTGVTRLRESSRITLFGHRTGPAGPTAPRVETLDGRDPLDDPSCTLLADLCTCDPDDLSLYRQPELHLFTLPTNRPAFGESIDVCGAMVIRKSFPRYASPERRWTWDTCVPRIPSKVLHLDSYVHRSLLPSEGAEPTMTCSLHGLNHSWERPDHPELELDQVDLRVGLQSIKEPGEGEVVRQRIRGVPHYTEACARVLRALGVGAESFTCLRAEVRYPVPLVSHTIWIPRVSRPD